MTKLIVLLPAHNEEKSIGKVLDRIPKSILNVDEIIKVVIDDGSCDRTQEIAFEKGAIVIRHKSNLGVGVALASGVDYALQVGADIMVNIDADGQFNPEEIPNLIKPIIDKKADFVAGNRFTNRRPANMPIFKYWGNKCMSKLINYIAGEKYQDVSCGFRAYSREALLNLNLFGRFTYTQEMFLNLHFKNKKIIEVPVSVKYFKDRESKVANDLYKYTWKTLNIIIRSVVFYKPLRFFGYPGLLFMFIGLFFIVFLLGHKFIIGSYSPYKAYGFIGGGLMIFGLIMVFIGLVADIIDKVRQTQEKILYYEKKRIYNKN